MTGFDFNSPVGVKAAVECHLLIVSAGFDIPAVRPELVEGNGSDAQDRPASTRLSAGFDWAQVIFPRGDIRRGPALPRTGSGVYGGGWKFAPGLTYNRWLHDRAQQELEHQTEEYYRSLSNGERKEDQQWSKIAFRSARRLWDK